MVLVCTRLPLPDDVLLATSMPLRFFALGMFGVIGAVLSELFPTAMRGSGLGFCYNLGRGLAGVASAVIGGSAGSLGLAHALGLYAAAAYALVIIMALLLPETRGRTFVSPGQV